MGWIRLGVLGFLGHVLVSRAFFGPRVGRRCPRSCHAGGGRVLLQCSLPVAAHIPGTDPPAILEWLANDWSCRAVPSASTMPVMLEPQTWGLKLQFVACPDDSIQVVVEAVDEGRGSVVVVKRGQGGRAVIGALGPQIASLVRTAEVMPAPSLFRQEDRVPSCACFAGFGPGPNIHPPGPRPSSCLSQCHACQCPRRAAGDRWRRSAGRQPGRQRRRRHGPGVCSRRVPALCRRARDWRP